MATDGTDRLLGRTAVVTGGNAGLGRYCAEQLAAAGATVVLACRSIERGRAAAESIATATGHPAPEVVTLDLADLTSVAEAAVRLRTVEPDLLVCNAGVTQNPDDARTADGFELMMGTNHLGHAALVGALLPALPQGARVLTVGSIAHRWSPLRPPELQPDRHDAHGRVPYRRYGRTKTATMMFAFELDRRAAEAGRDLTAVAAHPGLALDELDPPVASGWSRLGRLAGWAVQGKRAGAAALTYGLGREVPGGSYVGPSGPYGLAGASAVVSPARHTRNRRVAAWLWAETERLTGVPIRL